MILAHITYAVREVLDNPAHLHILLRAFMIHAHLQKFEGLLTLSLLASTFAICW